MRSTFVLTRTGFRSAVASLAPALDRSRRAVDHATMVADEAASAASGCPVDHENMSKEEIAAFMSQHRASQAAAAAAGDAASSSAAPEEASEAPSKPTAASPAPVYDVYGQEIDPSNMMPSTPNDLPSPGQSGRLSTDRESSSIPKSETAATWTYPSPQMFYNALMRKGKAADVEEEDMDSVVAVHNAMNEQTWNRVLEWERRFHCDECADPRLRRFRGRPDDLSPAARWRGMFRGYPRPFDRHDWVVDRCGKQDVRYVIDYYYREVEEGEPIELHVRPAADSVGAVWDRFRLGAFDFQRALFPVPAGARETVSAGGASAAGAGAGSRAGAGAGAGAPEIASAAAAVAKGSEAPVSDEEFKFLSGLTPEKIDAISEGVRQGCATIGLELARSKADPAAYEKANVALNYCMAKQICKPQAKGFLDALENKPGSETEPFVAMTACLDRFHVMARRVMAQAEGLPRNGPEET